MASATALRSTPSRPAVEVGEPSWSSTKENSRSKAEASNAADGDDEHVENKTCLPHPSRNPAVSREPSLGRWQPFAGVADRFEPHADHRIDASTLVYVMAASLLVGSVGIVAAQTREAAVESARRGEYDTAISSLQALAQAAPSDTGVRFDLAVVLQWAGRSREATDVFESTRATEAPEYVLSAMTRAYRDQQRWTDAAALAVEGGRRFPESAEWPLAARLAEGRRRPRSR